MRVILQRVTGASVIVDKRVTGEIEHGLLLLVGVTHTDTRAQADWLARKIATLRVFRAADGPSHFDRSVLDVGGAVLVVSQFTLYGDARKGRRPDFSQAARPELAAPLIEYFCGQLRAQGLRVETGVFGADMRVESANDGPVTLVLESGD
ncbi:MAG: D-aminoacyl-tRNA deacylase [Chloroflexi bacterium]|nr:D-aminoacyl-tRNA deacylase [Chloroflexota bacterium]MCL5275002.1 D-aminoacyl-tRNA deacylase [Chloroflexota bacterium]